MQILRRYLSILSAFLFVFTFNYGVANEVITKPGVKQEQEQEQEGRRKNDQTMIRPDGQYQSSSPEIDSSDPDPNEESVSTPNVVENTDSLQDDSVSKYNFIFYFLYKFKYEDESP
ncbi:hypothetical protein [Ekhidna sp.]|uniref:hypothetical protein n=1 Tax=Ekhidna sp. TaxID=2608089 RepID=UPI003B50B024